MLDFKAISAAIPIKQLLDHLSIPYEETDKEIKFTLDGNKCIANRAKNLFLSVSDQSCRGSVINLLAYHTSTDLKTAATMLQKTFLSERRLEREIPDLKLHFSPILDKHGITIDTCRDLEFGLVKERSVMAGKIAFVIRDLHGEKQGYVGWTESQGWYFPKGHKQSQVFNLYKCDVKEPLNLYDDPFAMALAYEAGERNQAALISSNMTDEQMTQVMMWPTINIWCKNYTNIANRLMTRVYVKICPY